MHGALQPLIWLDELAAPVSILRLLLLDLFSQLFSVFGSQGHKDNATYSPPSHQHNNSQLIRRNRVAELDRPERHSSASGLHLW